MIKENIEVINWVSNQTFEEMIDACFNGISGGIHMINYKPNDGIFTKNFLYDIIKSNQGDNDYDYELGRSGWEVILSNIPLIAGQYLKLMDKSNVTKNYVGEEDTIANIKKSLGLIAKLS